MKKNYLFRLALLLFAVTLGQSVWAEDEDPVLSLEQVDGVYQINNIGDWYALADYVREGGDTQGKTFKLMSDIAGETDDEIITEPIGCQKTKGDKTSRMRFAGTFDGGNHTINVRLESYDNDDNPNPNYCSPFAYCKNATIKNLKVTGTIYTEGTFAGGLVGQSGPDGDKTNGKITIDNVGVAVEMNCNYLSGDQGSGRYANQAGFVGIAEGNATITNSWFSGKLTGADFAYSGGFIGINKAQANLTNCWFIPTDVQASNVYGSSEFVHNGNGGKCNNLRNNCYYTTSFSEPEDAQGTKVVTSHGDEDIYETITAPSGTDYYIVKHYKSWMDVEAGLAGIATEIRIGANLTAGTLDAGFVVSRDVTIDLNGFTIDRALAITDAVSNGYVIKVEDGAVLTLKSSGEHIGTITGGHNTGNGGGILNEGTLNLEGVTVTGNFANQGAGIYNTGTLNVEGNVQVIDNKKNATTYNNVYLPTGNVINVVETLPTTATVHVTTQVNEAGTLVAAPAANVTLEATNFTSDNTTYFVAVYDEGENVGKAYLSNAPAIVADLENLDDNTAFITTNKGKRATLTLKERTLAKDSWNTLCLPFDVTVAQLRTAICGNPDASSLYVEQLSETSKLVGSTLTLDFSPLIAKTATIPAGTPFVVKGFAKTAPTFENVIIKDVLNDVTYDVITFKGTYGPTDLGVNNKSILFFGSNNVLYYPGSKGFTLGSHRAYFQFSSGGSIKSYVLNFGNDEDATSIDIIDEVESTTGAIYNLAGQRLNKKQKGINIVNGKKVLY